MKKGVFRGPVCKVARVLWLVHYRLSYKLPRRTKILGVMNNQV